MNIGNTARLRCAAVGAVLLSAAPARAGDGAWQTIADVGKYGVPASAAVITLADGDDEGLLQLAGTMALTTATTYALKRVVDERRPNGGRYSFPSGHTSTAFAGAGYLHARYGWEYGLSAAVAATVVGIARIETRDHHWYDVVAGAALGEGVGFLLASKRDSSVQWIPFADSRGAGFALTARF